MHAADLTSRRHPRLPRPPPAQGTAPVPHLRERGRRQEHAHRPAAARHEDDLRGPTRRREAGQREGGHHRGRRDRPGAAHRRAEGGARAGHHHRRGVPLLLHRPPQVHHRRHPRPRAVHPQHGHRRFAPASSPSSSSTPATACRRRPAGTRSSCRSSASSTSSSPSTRWTSSATREEVFERIKDDYTGFVAKLGLPGHGVHPHVGPERGQRRVQERRDAVVHRPGPARPPGDGPHRQRPQPRPTCGSRCST